MHFRWSTLIFAFHINCITSKGMSHITSLAIEEFEMQLTFPEPYIKWRDNVDDMFQILEHETLFVQFKDNYNCFGLTFFKMSARKSQKIEKKLPWNAQITSSCKISSTPLTILHFEAIFSSLHKKWTLVTSPNIYKSYKMWDSLVFIQSITSDIRTWTLNCLL